MYSELEALELEEMDDWELEDEDDFAEWEFEDEDDFGEWELDDYYEDEFDGYDGYEDEFAFEDGELETLVRRKVQSSRKAKAAIKALPTAVTQTALKVKRLTRTGQRPTRQMLIRALIKQLSKILSNRRKLAAVVRKNRAAAHRVRQGRSPVARRLTPSLRPTRFEDDFGFEDEFEADGDLEALDEMEYYAEMAAETESEAEADEFLGALASLAGPVISSILGGLGYEEDEEDPFLPALIPLATSLIGPAVKAVGGLLRRRRRPSRRRRAVRPSSRVRARGRRVVRPRYCVL